MNDILLYIAVALLAAFLSAISAIRITSYSFESAAVEHGCAQYNPKTAEFEWLGTEVK